MVRLSVKYVRYNTLPFSIIFDLPTICFCFEGRVTFELVISCVTVDFDQLS